MYLQGTPKITLTRLMWHRNAKAIFVFVIGEKFKPVRCDLTPLDITVNKCSCRRGARSFIFTPASPLKRVAGSAALRDFEMRNDFQQPLIL